MAYALAERPSSRRVGRFYLSHSHIRGRSSVASMNAEHLSERLGQSCAADKGVKCPCPNVSVRPGIRLVGTEFPNAPAGMTTP
jgi:hypothetical protein